MLHQYWCYFMVKKYKSKTKYLLIPLIVLVLITTIGYYHYNASKIWKTLDKYEDKSTQCMLELSTSLNTLDYNIADIQVTSCKKIINDGLFEIERWYRENPDNKEFYVAKLDYGASGYILDFYKILIDMSRNSYTSEQGVARTQISIELINKYLENVDLITNLYSHTEYYLRYYKPHYEELSKSRQQIIELRNQMQKSLECPSGYTKGDDGLCHEVCGSSNTYCTSGSCCNGECLSCQEGSYLAIDCKCYSK